MSLTPEAAQKLQSPERLVYHDAEPVFIVGSVRSGTSITVSGVRDGAKIRGFHEGNVATMVQRMLDQLDKHYAEEAARGSAEGSLISKTDHDAFATHIHNYVTALYVKTMGPGRWLDKSPEAYLEAPMIRYCPELLRSFPKAKFIWCVRRGIENIQSRQRKFPDIPFHSYCRSWSDAVKKWMAVRDQLEGRYLEVRQDEIATKPDRVAHAIAKFLEVGEAEREAIEDIFTNKRLEQSQFAQDHRWIGLDETPWDEDQRKTFIEHCSESMEALGYSIEGRTLKSAGPVRFFFPVTQTAIERHHVADDDAAFCKISDDGIGLRPNGPGEETAEIRYKNVALQGQSRFRAEVSLPSNAPSAVECVFRVESSTDHRVYGESTKIVQPGESANWSVDLEPLQGVFDVVIGSRLAPGATQIDGAQVVWRRSRLENVL